MEDFSLEYIGQRGTVLDYVLNGIADGVYIVDKQRRIIYWNKAAEEMTGYKAEEVLGYRCSEDILNHIDENGLPLCLDACPLSKALSKGESVKLKTYPLHKNGKRFPVMAHVSPIKSNDGKIIAAIEVFRDISKEEELRILQEKFNSLIRKFVSTATVERVMAQVLSGTETKSRRRELTILYLDVVQFTSLSERYSPENVAGILNEIFGICELITKECFGDIDKFIGDAIMAVFVDAEDAVEAGARILSALNNLNVKNLHQGKDMISVRIAIHSGNVVQAEVGTVERKDLTVIGDVVNTVAHIEKYVTPNSIFVTEATLSRLKNSSDFLFERRILLKGKKEPVTIYSLIKQEKLIQSEDNIIS
ncbi:MAG: PAS domain-containing protein [Bacillota bacterium]